MSTAYREPVAKSLAALAACGVLVPLQFLSKALNLISMCTLPPPLFFPIGRAVNVEYLYKEDVNTWEWEDLEARRVQPPLRPKLVCAPHPLAQLHTSIVSVCVCVCVCVCLCLGCMSVQCMFAVHVGVVFCLHLVPTCTFAS